MTHYRIYNIDEHGSIESGHDADCDNDDDALDLAHRLMKHRPRIEVWKGTRLVGCLSDTRVLSWGPQKAAPVVAGAA